LDEPWNSPHNRTLLAQIPAVYQSPERFDERTNYLVPVGSSTMFRAERGMRSDRIEDGLTNTVLLVEADDTLAIPWTEPRDYEVNLEAPMANLGSLRGDSFYVIWGGGAPGRLLVSTQHDALRAMFTADGGEEFIAGRIDQPLLPAVVPTKPSPAESTTDIATRSASAGQQQPDSAAAIVSSEDHTLANKYRQYSEAEFSAGHEREAMQWFYAAALVSPPGGDWVSRYQWVPGLRRPLAQIRFGIGLDYQGPRNKDVRDTSSTGTRRVASGQAVAAWTHITGEIGEQLTRALSAHLEQWGGEMLIGQRATASNAGTRRARSGTLLDVTHGASLSPGVYFLATARDAVLLQAARREGVDVLLIVDWRDYGHKWSAGFRLFDVVRNAPLVTLPRVSSAQLEQVRADPLASNPLVEVIRQLAAYLEKELVPQPLPEKIEPKHVVRRLESLAATHDEPPFRALTEMRFYCERGLADTSQLLLSYQALIGAKPGSDLVLGDQTVKEQMLKQWLPQPPATQEVAGITARRRTADDE
jgi:hypothetical protein